MKKHTPTEYIDALGGVAVTARIFGVSNSAVAQWKINGIPDARMMFIHAAYPNLFDDERRADCRRQGDRREGDRRQGSRREDRQW